MKTSQKSKMVRFITGVVGIGVLLNVAGCAATMNAREIRKAGNDRAMDTYENMRNIQRESRSFMVDEQGFYAAKHPISVVPINPSLSLPSSFKESQKFNVQNRIALSEIVARIMKTSGYEVKVDSDVFENQKGSAKRSSAPRSVATAPIPASPLPGDTSAPPFALPPESAPISMELESAPSDTVLSDLVYTGSLSGLLDEVTARLGLSWRWTGSRVEIFRYETKMFHLAALTGETTTSSKLSIQSTTSSGGSGSGGGSSGDSGNEGSSGTNMSVSNSMKVWSEIEDALKNMISDNGKMSVTPTAGTITVTDTPSKLRQIEAQVNEWSRIYSKQVTFHVEVYAIERQRGDDYALNWDAVWRTASSSFNLDINSNSGAGAGPSFTVGIKDGSTPWGGSSVAGQALSKLTNATLVTSGTATTLNNQMVPMNISREIVYVQSSSTSTTSGSDVASSSLTPGVTTEGFSMTVLPKIMDNNRVMMRYGIDLSTVESIETFRLSNSAIQMPRRSVRNFMQVVSVPSGRSLVLTGFQQASGSNNDQGPFSPAAWFAGGSKSSSASVKTIVIIVTPYVTEI